NGPHGGLECGVEGGGVLHDVGPVVHLIPRHEMRTSGAGDRVNLVPLSHEERQQVVRIPPAASVHDDATCRVLPVTFGVPPLGRRCAPTEDGWDAALSCLVSRGHVVLRMFAASHGP